MVRDELDQNYYPMYRESLNRCPQEQKSQFRVLKPEGICCYCIQLFSRKMFLKKTFPSLSKRFFDYFLIVAFSLFALTSFLTSSFLALNVPITPDSENLGVQLLYWYEEHIDPGLIEDQLLLQIQSFIDAFVFGPFYILLIYALIKEKKWIRLPSIVYVSAITYSMILYMGMKFIGNNQPSNQVVFLAINLPYLLIPLGLAYRMRHPNPFGKTSV